MIVEDGPSPFLCFPNSLCAQSIFGRVVAAGDTAGVTTANLALSDSTGAVVARVQVGESGDFRLPAPGPGRFVVRENMKGVHGMAEEIRVFDPHGDHVRTFGGKERNRRSFSGVVPED